MAMIKKIISILLLSLSFSIENSTNQEFLLFPGPNLVSFNVTTDDLSIQSYLESIEDNIISIITQGEIGLLINDQWVGGLSTINNYKGYWIVVSDWSIFSIGGEVFSPTLYFLYEGHNLISYPYENNQPISNAISTFALNNISAIIGQNKAMTRIDGINYGSLTQFEKDKAYWVIVNQPTPFSYNNPMQFSSNENNYIFDYELEDLGYNQSISQSIFFIDEAYINGQEINNENKISIFCNNNLTGAKFWIGNMTDVIAMGDDGYGTTNDYCIENDITSIIVENQEEQINMHTIGNNVWLENNISIISISDCDLGDVSLDHTINVSDIILLIEHIVLINTFNNSQQILLADSNQDGIINVSDVVFNVNTIFE